jgi:hypothetical protein
MGSAGPINLEREELESSLADLNQLMRKVRIRPHVEGNRPGGFLVSNIKPGSLFAKMGLRNGDVIHDEGKLLALLILPRLRAPYVFHALTHCSAGRHYRAVLRPCPLTMLGAGGTGSGQALRRAQDRQGVMGIMSIKPKSPGKMRTKKSQ